MILTIIVGFLSGVAASLGLGGGFVLLLYLTAVANAGQMQAQGVNLVFFLPIAALSLIIHAKNGFIEKKPLLPAILWGVIGVLVGSFIAFHIPIEWLSKLFAGFILILGIKELFFPKKENKKDGGAESKKPANR
ncbi:sulfite exporter TauE/SafE family protein [Massilioclostridium coli]|uniref:sulfite exporter TauE/SafE family protein n=1 Tax=Massilioclostridium coli TaxID=1870991 RepID=UPI0022E2619F|nr:sulfite exporter TauE/SafE family protein [Massilioclostridium coli]